VENAIRHGLSTKVGPGHLRISATRDRARLALSVQDDGLGATLPLRQGVGIANTRARLEEMYAAGASLDIDSGPNAGFLARIRIPLSGGRE
jgi:sensor histidine kinase YesM